MDRLQPGAKVGPYIIERELATTRTGIVYDAAHSVLPRRAAIKVAYAPHTRARSSVAVELLREACIVEALQHPGIPHVYEVGRLDDGRPWAATEHVEGTNLAKAILRGPMEPTEVAAILRDLAEVLATAHQRGVLHCGLRPDRIELTPGHKFPLHIADWTDARTHDAPDQDLCLGSRGGSLYVAPELGRGDAIDDRADVFALGVIGYLAITGVRPATGPDDVYIPVLTRRIDAPSELARLIDLMLSANRYDRPSAAEIQTFLTELVVEEIAVEEVYSIEAPLQIRRPRWTPPLSFAAIPESIVDDGWADPIDS